MARLTGTTFDSMSVFSRIRRARQWKVEHNEAWAGMDAPEPDGLSLFQHRCLSALRSAVRIDEPAREGETEFYLSGSVSQARIRFWIYTDGAQASGADGEVMLERWDYRTPEELIEQLIVFVVDAAASNKAAPADAAKGPPRG